MPQLNENARNLKANNNDIYLALHLAPASVKPELYALFNFHHEISRIAVEVSEPMVGLIKFQWWRDCLAEIQDGKPPRPHPVLKDLKNVGYAKLTGVVDEYEKLLEWQPQNIAELQQFVENTHCIIFAEAAKILGTEYDDNAAKAYAYIYLSQKLAKKPEQAALSAKLKADAASLLPNSNTALNTITRHRIVTGGQRWKLLLKLIFSTKLL